MAKSSKIGILGSGMVGQHLAKGFVKYNYETIIGTSNPGKLKDWSTTDGKGVKIASFEEVGKQSDILVLGVKGTAAQTVLGRISPSDLAGKVVIDATNPISDEGPEDGVLRFFTDQNDSLMEQLQRTFKEAKFVKAFNSVGAPLMVNPDFGGIRPTMFICGNDNEAKNQVKEILDQFGWETEDMGTAIAARAIEPLCVLWCIPGFRENRWAHAFKLLKLG